MKIEGPGVKQEVPILSLQYIEFILQALVLEPLKTSFSLFRYHTKPKREKIGKI